MENVKTKKNVDLQFRKQLVEKMQAEIRDMANLPKDAPIDTQTNLFEFGLDSLMALELENRLEIFLKDKCRVDSNYLLNFTNIDEIADYIVSLSAENTSKQNE